MRLLLDTTAFLWWLAGDERLSARATRAIGNRANDVYLSVASAWEIVVKEASGKLTLPSRPEVLIPEQIAENGFVPLPVQLAHVLGAGTLPEIHRDPFDRLLVAQAIAEGLKLVSADENIRRYAIRVIW
ncbi:MAG: type II toxin-antitoxin system VapC family toxin [Actinomycetota bacterium]